MAQIYLLTVMITLIGGIALSGDRIARKLTSLQPLVQVFEHKNARRSVGTIAVIIGVAKLIVRSPGENVPVAGDLLPSLAGTVLGLLLFFSAFKDGDEEGQQSDPSTFIDKALKARAVVGVICILISFLHFLLPGVLFL